MKPELSPKIKLEHPTRPDGKTLLTFDCYGTLIDWEAGISAALQDAYPLACEVDEPTLLEEFHSAQNARWRPYRKYRQLLTEVSMHVAKENGWDERTEPAETIPASIPRWLPFPDTNAALNRLADAGVTLGILSNIDNDLLAGTLEHFRVTTFPFIATAEDLRSYKPSTPHFVRGREWATEHQTWLHVAQSLFHDVEPASELGIPVVWVNRKSETLPSTVHPIHVASDLANFAEWFLGP